MKTTNFLVGAISGALIGAITTILLTPQSGEDLRMQARDRFDQFVGEARAAAQARRAQLEGELASLRAPHPE